MGAISRERLTELAASTTINKKTEIDGDKRINNCNYYNYDNYYNYYNYYNYNNYNSDYYYYSLFLFLTVKG